MPIAEQIPDSDATFLRRGEGELAVVFVHGFLDDQHVWDKVIDELKTPGVLRTGHRLRLHITSSDFPRWERNPGTWGPSVSATEALAADQTVFHDHEHPSHVTLPVVPR